MIAYCLADVFNLDLWPRHKPPVQPEVEEGLHDLIGQVISAVPSATEVTIRLYGGWHRETLTAPVDMRHMMSRAIENNPKRYRAQRIRVQLADHPIWDSATRLTRSLVESPMTRVSVRLSPAEHCAFPHSCTLDALSSWCSGKCPEQECPVRLRQVAQRRRQKMVDTLLTADAMAIIQDGRAHAVIIASDDADMIPALLALSASDVSLTHLRRRVAGGPVTLYDHVFEKTGSHIRSW
ncbi:MAG: NYN domain-containing protein [Gemmatimonadales bacterium]|nr:NYN domain-containing protein [Gemmatimonadales bacterium]MXX78828.1 NYN domain-containing protein [Gemmatimonadales bacterium]MYC86794.1 NYN domain-containing protein [Candidatus Palauibacter denitrificans]